MGFIQIPCFCFHSLQHMSLIVPRVFKGIYFTVGHISSNVFQRAYSFKWRFDRARLSQSQARLRHCHASWLRSRQYVFAAEWAFAQSQTLVLVFPKCYILRDTSPFFPGILLSRKPPKTLGKQLENNGESTPRYIVWLKPLFVGIYRSIESFQGFLINMLFCRISEFSSAKYGTLHQLRTAVTAILPSQGVSHHRLASKPCPFVLPIQTYCIIKPASNKSRPTKTAADQTYRIIRLS